MNKQSGAANRKRAKEKLAQENEVIGKMRKLSNYFSTANRNNESDKNDNNDGIDRNSPIPSPELLNPTSDSNNQNSQDIPNSFVEQSQATENPADPAPCNSNSTFTESARSSSTTNESSTPSHEFNPETPPRSSDSSDDISDDPAKWIINDKNKDILIRRGIKQNTDHDFSKTKRTYNDCTRCLTMSSFVRTLVNGESQRRLWLIYSESLNAVFCAPCTIFKIKSSLTDGYSDWRNIHQRLREHERSRDHISSNTAFLQRSTTLNRVDIDLLTQAEHEISYWTKVLQRVVEVIKSLSICGLAFRGTNEKFNTDRSGNYIMALELLAQFDTFLEEHIRTHGNKGKGSTSYLSSTICDEFIQLMGDHIIKVIVNQVKLAKYFSIVVDSSPDISHVDQLSFVLRFVNELGQPKERFIKFFPNSGHKARDMFTVVTECLDDLGLDIANCRGQSYDNASNMSGKYNGLQAKLKILNPLAEYVPCSGHSLNLIGECAAEAAQTATLYFCSLQGLYNFFSASNSRWEFLEERLEPRACTVKSLSITRWSARSDACKSLLQSWDQILSALQEFSEDRTYAPKARAEALGLYDSLNTLDDCFMTIFWNDVLHRFNAVNKLLQSEKTDLSMVVGLYGSLVEYVRQLREEFDTYERKAIDKCGLDQYRAAAVRARPQTRRFDESDEPEAILSARDSFRVKTFYVIVDTLSAELDKRRKSYEKLYEKFGFLSELHSLTSAEISERSNRLVEIYPNDLEDNLDLECEHLKAHLSTINKQNAPIIFLNTLLNDSELSFVYPNVSIALRIFFSIPSTNCSAERSFSALKRIKNYLRSSISQTRLNSLAIMNIESDLTKSLNFNDLIQDFAQAKVRRGLFN